MAVKNPLKEVDWAVIKGSLYRTAYRWWDDNKENLIYMGKEELAEVADALSRGDMLEAKLTLGREMTRDEWQAYRDGTTSQLQGLARRRAALVDALEDLGVRTARTIGGAMLSHFR